MTLNKFFDHLFLFAIILCCNQPVFAQQTLSLLQRDLDKAITSRARADVCFDFSRKYADALKIDSALFYAERIKEYSQKDNYETGLGKYHLALSLALHYRNLTEETKKNAKEAIKIFTDQKEYSFLGIAYWQLATTENLSGDLTSARSDYWKSIHFLMMARDNYNLFRTYFWLGRSYDNTSDYDSAASYFIKALMLAEESKDAFKIYNAATDLGETFLSLRNLSKAAYYLDYGLKHRTPTVNKVGLWVRIGEYANCLSLLHNFTKADSAIKEFEILAARYNTEWGWINLDKLRGIQAYEKQNYPEALKYLNGAYNKERQVDINKIDMKDIVLNLARTEFKMEQYDSAILHLKYAAQISRSLKASVDEIEAGFLLSASYEKINKPDSALHYFRQYSDLKESVLSLEKQKILAEVSTRYESEKKEQEIKILQKESEVNSYLLQLRNQQIEKQQLEDEKKSQQLALVSQQNEINKLDASQKSLSLDNEIKQNEEKQTKLKLLENEAAFQKLLASKQSQQNKITWASVAIILILGSSLIYRYMRRRKLQNQQDVLNERLRISRELHDEVGSTLSGIAMYSHLTREQIKAERKDEVESSLNNIQQSAGEMINKLSDIVWLINPEKDSFQRLIERLEEFATSIALIKNIEVKVDLQKQLTDVDLPVDKRRNIYLFCKEAITNAIKYSAASIIELTMKEIENKRIGFFIKDNGKGFDPLQVRKGDGLVNMQRRAEKMNGEFSLQTAPGYGTTVSLVYKIT